MPLVNAPPSTGMAEAYGRVNTVVPASVDNATEDANTSARVAPAGAGPAAVVTISEAARGRSEALSGAVQKPGINNGTMASEEAGNATQLRNMLAERYDAQAARLNESPT